MEAVVRRGLGLGRCGSRLAQQAQGQQRRTLMARPQLVARQGGAQVARAGAGVAPGWARGLRTPRDAKKPLPEVPELAKVPEVAPREGIPADGEAFQAMVDQELERLLQPEPVKKRKKPFKKKRDIMAARRKWHIVRGDRVGVIGGMHKGLKGKVIKVDRKADTVIVEGVNLQKVVYFDEDALMPVEVHEECPIHYSNVNLLDPKDESPTRIAIKFDEDGNRVRVAKRSGMPIPKPVPDYARDVAVNPLDTPADLVLKRTYFPEKEAQAQADN